MSKPSRDWKKDVDSIRPILLTEWNPIGCIVPDDEYDSYIPTIYLLLQERATDEELAMQLQKFETISMCLRPRPEINRRVAKMLLDLVDNHDY